MNAINSWFADTRVRYKILTGFGAVVLLMWALAAIVYVQAGRVLALAATSQRAVENLTASDALDLAVADKVVAFRGYFISGTPDDLQAYEDANSRYLVSLAALRRNLLDPTHLAQVDAIEQLAEGWTESSAQPGIALRQRTLEPGGPPLDSLIVFFLGAGRVDPSSVREAIEGLRVAQREVTNEARTNRDAAVREIRLITVLTALGATILSIFLASFLAGVIARGLRTAVDFAGTVAEGDFTSRIQTVGGDEVGQLVGTLNRMADDLRRTVSGVTSSTAQVATAAQQIATTSEEISVTTDHQVRSTEETSTSMEQIAAQIARVARSSESLAASVDQTSSSVTEMSNSIEETAASTDALGTSVEQTSATIEEMVVSIVQVGRHVTETEEITRKAEEDARTGGDAVHSTIRGMRRIHGEMETLAATVKQLGSASASIGMISEVIEDIADQTNLLALNASIEAARAGEHGRGFSVVAQEIRRLAERSVESTREISTTIRQVVSDMERVVKSSAEVAGRTNEGIGLADSAGGALENIIGSAGRARVLMEEVSMATKQQIKAAEQAQEAIRHIQQVTYEVRVATREQAKGSRQIAEAVDNMNRQTKEVFAATAEQKKGGDLVLQATEQINQGAQATQMAIREMARAAQDLSSQANRLTQLVSSFRV